MAKTTGITLDAPLDALDTRIVAELSEDGLLAAGEIAQRLGVTAPTVRSRVKAMLASGLMRIAAMVDPAKHKGLTIAMVGLNVTSHSKLQQKLDEISALGRVNWAAIVTGRYDILVEVVLPDGMDGLYHFIDEDLSRVGDITASESFVVMKANRKWINLPPGARTSGADEEA